MDARIVPIGNSRGVRLPKPLIEEAGLGERVSLRVVDGGVLIEPRPETRAGWAEAARLARERDDDIGTESWPPTRFDTDGWEWEPAREDAR
ncbi:AbrB/MazE/SpoVT family DNA-binding domain-containing protein [Candidatus Poriferisodalis sp.]|uniref:AbrB/MazE/SpoVT family DNA-binding domain-containing protein n=1 Tax=Candidatus Poriferisodalis sp. TaxID=3101277 RepID=UPI003C6EDF7E